MYLMSSVILFHKSEHHIQVPGQQTFHLSEYMYVKLTPLFPDKCFGLQLSRTRKHPVNFRMKPGLGLYSWTPWFKEKFPWYRKSIYLLPPQNPYPKANFNNSRLQTNTFLHLTWHSKPGRVISRVDYAMTCKITYDEHLPYFSIQTWTQGQPSRFKFVRWLLRKYNMNRMSGPLYGDIK